MLQGAPLGAIVGRAGRLRAVLLTLLLLLAVLAARTPIASAEIGETLVQFGEAGSGAGQLQPLETNGAGGGIEADPSSGHVFIAETGNHRISEFTAWGVFVKAWGFGVAGGAGAQTCTVTCQKGISGSAPGQLDSPNGVALDAAGNLYVFERLNGRVQVFDQAGQFLRMFGGGVNETTGADVCTKADVDDGDDCGAGSVGTGPSEWELLLNGTTAGDYIDIGSDGTVYVGDRNRIQKFDADGTFQTALALPAAGEPGALSIDPVSGDIYFAYGHTFLQADAFRLSATTGAVIDQLPTNAPQGLTAAATGDLYVADDLGPGGDPGLPEFSPLLLQIDPLGVVVDECCHSSDEVNVRPRLAPIGSNTVTAGGGVALYVMHSEDLGDPVFVDVRGPAPDKWPPPLAPPSIVSQFATDVSDGSASLGARINPNFWADTRYYVEYGTSECSLGGCTAIPVPPGALLGGGIVKKPIATDPIELTGLQPGVTYFYRFIAQSGGGGPTVGQDQSFTTFPSPGKPNETCVNAQFRIGPALGLADCRAYEMVSPLDKLSGDVLVQCTSVCFPARLNQSDLTGGKISYSSYRAYGDSQSASYTSQFLATRTQSGWSNHAINPRREGESVYGSNSLDSPYRAFLDDLSGGWFLQDTQPLLAANAQADFANIYHWGATGDIYETVTKLAPSNTSAAQYVPELQGFSADGTHAVFAANGKLTANASASATQVYESFPGGLRLVSIRPNGTASSVNSSVGTSEIFGSGRQANVDTAVSDDASRIYWSEGEGTQKIYVRVGGTETVAVSGNGSTFWAATPSGSEAIYTEGSELKLFDLASKSSIPLATSVQGVMGASEDLNRVYFVSTAALAPGAVAGQRNLFLYEEGGSPTFIAALSADDFRSPPAFSPTAVEPWRRVSRVTPDGDSMVFMSRASLTGMDNADTVNGQADAEVFRYDASDDELLCVSCSPAGASPTGRQFVMNKNPSGYWYASSIPGWEFQLHAPRVLADDGSRVFFNSFSKLALADTNGVQDVYQWEAPGSGECEQTSPEFSDVSGGCVTLITNGKDEADSEFIDANADGDDVFFTTGASLVSWDPAQIDLYDARVGGGFPPPPSPPAECVGESCQPRTPPPAVAPVGSNVPGAGNPKQRPKCKKGFVRKKGKCVRKHKKKPHKSKAQKNSKGRGR